MTFNDGIQYKPDGTIDIIETEEGVARNNAGGSYSYEYNLSDHLGNVRYTFNRNPVTGQLAKIQADDYFAFGLRKAVNPGVNKYLYNGKELQEELGQLDYGARFYDPEIGPFNTIDPMPEVSRRWGTYSYAANNPIRFIDVDGMFPSAIGYSSLSTGSGNDMEDDTDEYLYVIDKKDYAKILEAYGIDGSGEGELGDQDDKGKKGQKSDKNAQEPKSKDQQRQEAYNSWMQGLTKFNDLMNDFMQLKMLAEGFVEVSPSKLIAIAKRGSALRAAYVAEVKGLSSIAEKMRRGGSSSKEIARVLHGLRRELGVKYKSLTPENLLKHIYQRNLEKYGDKLGPSIDYLRKQGKSWDDIIESATRPGDKDLGF